MYINYSQEDKIKDLLLFRKIVEVKNGDTLVLDNGIELEIQPNEGCGGCNAGWYDIEMLNTCDNAITNVEFDEDWINNGNLYSYSIFVLAADNRIKVLQVDGHDDNGYYGTGYKILVKQKNN